MRPVMRRVRRQFVRLAWHLNNAPLTDEERFALRLANRHLEDGRPDLAVEDLEWLLRRYTR